MRTNEFKRWFLLSYFPTSIQFSGKRITDGIVLFYLAILKSFQMHKIHRIKRKTLALCSWCMGDTRKMASLIVVLDWQRNLSLFFSFFLISIQRYAKQTILFHFVNHTILSLKQKKTKLNWYAHTAWHEKSACVRICNQNHYLNLSARLLLRDSNSTHFSRSRSFFVLRLLWHHSF